MDAIERAATKNGYRVEAFSGKNARSSKTTNHPSGRAADIRIIDPATGQPLGGDASPDMSPKLFRQYEAFANDVHKEFVAANPAREKDFRWGGYFVQGTPMDLMHFDVSGGNMAAGNFKKGLSPQYAKLWGVPGASPVQTGAASSGNPQVAALQQQLNSQGASLKVDGILGPRTLAAQAKYQAPAQAYAPTPTASPAQQAAARQSYGAPDPQVAAMQRDLNSRGAQLKVDGLRGPLTRAAEQQFMGSPTSVRTPNFTAAARTPYTSGQQDRGMVPRPGIAPTPAINQPYTPAAATPRTPTYNNPYTNSTGGANATPYLNRPYTPQTTPQTPYLNQPYTPAATAPRTPSLNQPYTPQAPRAVPQTPSLNQPYSSPNYQAITPRPVPTQSFPQTPAYQNPYTNSNGGASALQAPRLPQPRPAYPLQPVVTAPTGPTLMQQLQDQMRRAAAVAAQVGGQFKDAYSQGTRSGINYSGGSYTGGGYGGSAGRSIASGVGGAFKNR
jgi:hypothetical protein